MAASSVNGDILSDLDSVQEMLRAKYIRLDSMAVLDVKYRLDADIAFQSGVGSLAVQVGAPFVRVSGDGFFLAYILAKINNLHLAFGGPRLIIAAEPPLLSLLRMRFQPESRMREIYGDSLRVEFVPESLLGGFAVDAGTRPRGAAIPPPAAQPGRVVGVDIGGTNVKSILYENGAILRRDIRKTPILEASSTDLLVDELVETVRAVSGPELRGVGIAWPAPLVDGRIVTPIKIPNIYAAEKLSRVSDLRRLLGERLGLPVTLLNDGVAGALSIARTNGFSDTLCIGLGYSVSAGFISSSGGMLPQMELCAATIGFEDGTAKKVRDFLSLKFGIPAIAQRLSLHLEGQTSLEQAEYLVNMSMREYTDRIGYVFTLLGMYLAEMIAFAHNILAMKNAAVFGGLTKNELVVASAQRWLATAHSELPVKFINTKVDNQFINAVGAAISALEG